MDWFEVLSFWFLDLSVHVPLPTFFVIIESRVSKRRKLTEINRVSLVVLKVSIFQCPSMSQFIHSFVCMCVQSCLTFTFFNPGILHCVCEGAVSTQFNFSPNYCFWSCFAVTCYRDMHYACSEFVFCIKLWWKFRSAN